MTAAATRASGKALPCPDAREIFALPMTFSDADILRMRQGFVPADMDDRWFIFFEDGWLYFHRSWTGACIFGLRLDGAGIVEGWVSRDEAWYTSSGLAQDLAMVERLIRDVLLV